MKKALEYHQSGNRRKAKEEYRRLLEINPKDHRARYLLGLSMYQEGNFLEALKLFQTAISLSPNAALYHKDLGNCFKQLGDCDQALERYRKALSLKSDFPEAYYDMGNMLLITGDLKSARDAYQKAISFRPDYLQAFINLAITHQQLGDYPAVISVSEKAVKLQPNDALSYNNLGNAYTALGETQKAISAFKKAITIRADFTEAHCNLGILLWELMDYQTAISCFEAAIAHSPKDEKPYLLLASLYQQKGKHDTALKWFNKTIFINPKCSDAHAGIGQSSFEKKQEQKAISSYLKAIDLNPDSDMAYVGLIKAMLYSCSWLKLDEYGRKLDRLTLDSLRNGKTIYETPFLNLIRHSDKKKNFQIARSHSQALTNKIAKLKKRFEFNSRRQSDGKIHIGYLSNNFRNHPTANLLLDIFSLHNRDEFIISCYSYGPDDKSYQREEIRNASDSFVDLDKLNNIDAAQKIYEEKVDILVDLVGYLKDGRMDIAAVHSAPIQIRWLGMAGTSGADFYEYLIADKMVIPLEDADCYSEKIIYLPDCYQVNSNHALKLKETSRAQWGLPPDFFVFCSFNAAYKIDPKIFQTWLNILKKIPKSVLWLMVESDLAEENLSAYARKQGVAPERIIFAERLSRIEHLQRLTCADLALDTCIVSGAATTSDALWAKVPVVTIYGNHFASRMSASILNAVELSELVTVDLDTYQQKAVQLAQSPERVDAIKNTLSNGKQSSLFFDTKRGVTLLENAYKMVWRRYIDGQPPESLAVF